MIRFTPVRDDRTYIDEHGVTIHYSVWKAGTPRAVIQLAHGLGEHALRYEQLVADLANAGYTVYADDHRGHGRTGMQQWDGDHTRMGKLGPGGLRATVAAVRQLTRIIRDENPDVPLVLLGHSWGSLLAQIIINQHPGGYDAAVLSGTAYRTLRHMNGGDLAARHPGPTGYEWLSRDPAIAEAFDADPLGFPANATKLFGIRDAMRLLGKPARNLAHDLPLLIQVGSDDTFGGEESAEKLAQAYLTRSGLTDVELIVYTDARHEVYNETNRDEVVADLLAWLDTHLPVTPVP